MVVTLKKWNKLRKCWQDKLDNTSVRQWMLAILFFAAIYAILMINLWPTGFDLEVGQVSRADIVAPRTVINREQTQRLQDEASKRAVSAASEDSANYELNHATIIRAEERVRGVFGLLVQGIEQMELDDPTLKGEQIRDALYESWGVELHLDLISSVIELELEEFQGFTETTTSTIMDHMNQRISQPELQQARNDYSNTVSQLPLSIMLQRSATQIGLQIIQPNLVLDTAKVELIRLDAVSSVEPVTILRGEVVLRKGDVVREEHIQYLQDLGMHRTGIDYLALLGLVILVGLLLSVFGVFLHKYQHSILDDEGQLALLGSVVIVVSFIAKILSLIQWPEAALLTPVALVGILIAILLDSRTGIMATIIISVVVALIFESLVISLMALIGGLVAVFSVSQVSQRGDLMRAGFVVGATNFLVMIGYGLMLGDVHLMVHSYLGVLNGAFSSVIAIGLLPYLESFFGITSAIRLLELSNPNQPLLRRLLMETPGTYHHSILVGNLAEAAAEAVHADGLLARVGSTYHDIGKLKRPYFFVENQIGMENPHDKIAPTLSTLIITSHVKDGLELARDYKLPSVISKFIAQHHGTDLVKYFYHRAKENGVETVQEKDFRYPGSKPQTKETAIVSLADAVEAAVRSLVKPTPGKIETLVKKIIRDRLDDGQLDESEITFKDLDKLADAFVKVLIGIFHARVEYPENITREDIEGKGN